MSYCRFSSEDFSCDVYVYDDAMGGTTVHVAGNRYVGDVPKADYLFSKKTMSQYSAALKIQRDWIHKAKCETLQLSGTACIKKPA